jgi:hypothetical protein
MTAKRGAIAVAWAALLWGAAPASAAPPSPAPLASSVSPPDTVRAAHAPADTLVRSGARPDSAMGPFRMMRPVAHAPGAPTPIRPPGLGRINLGDARKRGDVTLEEALRLSRATAVAEPPLYGPMLRVPRLPDAGTAVRMDGQWSDFESATDRTIVTARSAGSRGLDLATTLADPELTGTETLNLDALGSAAEPRAFQGAGDALALLEPIGGPDSPAETRRAGGKRPRSTLMYRNGTGGALGAGVRFESPLLGRGVRASYTHWSADGVEPLDRMVSTRYSLDTALPSILGQALSMGGALYKRTLTDDRGGEGIWDARSLALRLRGRIGRVSHSWVARAAGSKQTQVSAVGLRERWELPSVSILGEISAPAGSGRSAVASVRAASRRVSYRVGSSPAFEPRRGEARASAGLRQALPGRAGMGLDAAYDAREKGPGVLDARASLWVERPRVAARLDLERSHERPSWIDLLTPARAETLDNPLILPPIERLLRSGNPALRPRRLSGLLGWGTVSLSSAATVGVSGSLRRVSDDFGWDLVRRETVDTLFLDALARPRGDGWVSYAAASWRLRAGPIAATGVAWLRGSPDRLSPESGSPPRRALDASLESRVTLFQGDLPLRFEVRAHATGPRRGPIDAPAMVLWDAALKADLDQAGVFLEFDDVFDRAPPSGVYEIEPDRGAPSPGRTFHFGVVWNLID